MIHHLSNDISRAGAEHDLGWPFLRVPFSEATAEQTPWGNERASLTLARRRFDIVGLTALQAAWVRDRYGSLGSGSAGRRATVRVWRAPGELFRAYESHRHPTSLRLTPDVSTLRLAGLFLCAVVKRCAATTALSGADLWVPGGDRRSFDWAIDNLIRVLAAYAVAETGGALVHSAAVIQRDGVSLFFGHSNDGKTTLARRFAAMGFDVLGDDLHLVSPAEEGGFSVEPMPYAGLYGRTRWRVDRHPLGSLHRLRRAARGAVRPLGCAEGVGQLVACTPFVNGDPWWHHRTLDVALRLVRTVSMDQVSLTLADDPARLLGIAAS